MTILVTGGAGFIGSNFILDFLEENNEKVINLDSLTYAGNLSNLKSVENSENYIFVKGNILDRQLVDKILLEYKPNAVINFAAESHVDRSIHGPEDFIKTNIFGTFNLLQASLAFWKDLPKISKESFRFLHVSTDEVYGSLEEKSPPFSETNRYEPNSPYSASKASSDHLVRAYYHTYDLPVLTTNCSNNYGPYQFPEKLIPLVINNALAHKPLPIYGDGKQIRDWLFVGDHCKAIQEVLKKGLCGEVYNIGGLNEKKNIEIVQIICSILDELKPIEKNSTLSKYFDLVTYIEDRPGHDQRYAIDSSKIKTELGWTPDETFETGIRKTVKWYLENQKWIKEIESGEYLKWVEAHYK